MLAQYALVQVGVGATEEPAGKMNFTRGFTLSKDRSISVGVSPDCKVSAVAGIGWGK